MHAGRKHRGKRGRLKGHQVRRDIALHPRARIRHPRRRSRLARRQTRKGRDGYDLVHLIVGSEGTLGIATAAIIRLIGLPAAKSDLLVLFRSPQEAISSVPIILSKGHPHRHRVHGPPERGDFLLLSERESAVRGVRRDAAHRDGWPGPRPCRERSRAVGDLCMEQGAIEVYVADNRTTQERLWAIRRNIAEAFKVYCPVQSLEDIVVPPAAIPAVIPELERISGQFGVTIPCYGHAGDGNLHATLVKDPDMPMEDWHRIEPLSLTALYEAITRLGGKISGEHGIGLKRKEYMKKFMSPVELGLLKTIKRAWDPNLYHESGKDF